MAKIVFAAGTSHTPMLLASDETLARFVETDQNIRHRDKEGRPVTYGDLLEKADPKPPHRGPPGPVGDPLGEGRPEARAQGRPRASGPPPKRRARGDGTAADDARRHQP